MALVPKNSVIMLVRAMHGGGAQRDAIELANGLRADGWPMAIVTLDPSGPLVDRCDPTIPIISPGPGKRLRMAAAVSPLIDLFNQLQPGAVVASEAAANCLLAFAVQRLPVARRPAVVLREVAVPMLARCRDPHLQNRLAYRLAPWFYPRADRVVSFTAGVQKELTRYFGVAPERAINLGTNAVLTRKRLAELGRPVETVPGLVVAVGRLSPEKGFADLVAAFADISARLLILGEGPERLRLERQIARLGLADRVTLAGFHPDPMVEVQRASLFVSASRHEGFGNAIVEALACGTPVVATDAPYGPDTILAGGRFGALVPPGDRAALTTAICAGLKAIPDRDALRARAADFTTERAAERFGAMLADMGLSRMVQP